MKQVIVEAFGGVEQLKVVEVPTPEPGPGQVRVRITSIGMNHAELMSRRGEYRLASGEPPFTPGLEAGGIIDAVGDGVTDRQPGQRVILGVQVPRLSAGKQPGSNLKGAEGTYRSHYICTSRDAWRAPDAIPDEQLGAIWLAYLTAWGCLVWLHGLRPDGPRQIIALPAASSGVALAAAQIIKAVKREHIVVGLTTSARKSAELAQLDTCVYDQLILTRDIEGNPLPWYKSFKTLTADHPSGGVDVFFDPVAAGRYLETEIRCLGQKGVVYIYGLLGSPDKVDVTPLIRKSGSLRGWALNELVGAGPEVVDAGCQWILDHFAAGALRQHVSQVFALEEVAHAHEVMERGAHVGKLVLVP